MTDDALLARVRLMRERGSSPKQIAKALGLRPAVVAPLVRQVAALQQSHDALQLIVASLQTSPSGLQPCGLRQTPTV